MTRPSEWTAADLPQNAKRRDSVEAAVANQPSVLEPKLDGWRLLVHVAEDGVHLYSRTGKSYDGKLPHVAAELARVFPTGTWIDGEAVAIETDATGVVHRWATAQSCLGGGAGPAVAGHERVSFVAFDLLAYDDTDSRSLTYANRRTLLEKALDREGLECVALVEQLDATEENLEALVAKGYEGAVVKHIEARYASKKRGAGWFKLKQIHTTDVVVTGFKEGINGLTGRLGALRYSQPDADGNLVESGTCGSGISDRLRDDIDADRESWLGRVIEVMQLGTPGESHRPASFKRERTDKTASEATPLSD